MNLQIVVSLLVKFLGQGKMPSFSFNHMNHPKPERGHLVRNLFTLFFILCCGLVTFAGFSADPRRQAGAAGDAFGRGGFVTLEGMTAVSVDLQSDGKIIVAGNHVDGCKCLMLRRYHADGRLDQTFGSNGQVTGPDDNNPYTYPRARKVLVDDQDRILVAANNLLARYTPAGQLDNSFSDDGIVLEDDTAWADVDIDSQGRVVVAGTTHRWIYDGWFWDEYNSNFAVGRYLDNGALDLSFNNGGFDFADFDEFWDGPHVSSYDYAVALAIDDQDRPIVAGSAQDSSFFDPSGEDDLAVVRFMEGGGPDPRFGDEGYLKIGLGDEIEQFNDVAVLPDGRILLAGVSAGNGDDDGLTLVKLHPNGDFDNSFSYNGKLIQQITQFYDSALQLLVLEDGRFLVAGASGGKMLLIRFHPDGFLDQTFSYSRQGKVSASLDRNLGMARQEDGKLILVADNRLVRFNAEGTLDQSYFPGQADDSFAGFNERGLIAENDFQINAVTRQEDGTIIAAGSSRGVNGFNDESSVITVKRYTPNGELDNDFGQDGTALIPLRHGAAFGVTMHPNGNIIVSGTTGSYAGEFFTVAALTPEGEDTWIRLLNPADNLRVAYDVAVDVGGSIVAVGSAVDGDNHDFIVARLNEFGIPDATFGNDGVVHSGLGESERATHVAIQPDGDIVAAGTREEANILGSDTDFVVARFDHVDGQLDDSFHNDGYRDVAFGENEFLGGLAIEPVTNKIVLAGSSDGRLAIARLNPDGSLDGDFDDDGMAVFNNVGGAGGVDVQPGGRIIAATSKGGVVSLAWITGGGAFGGLFQRGDGAVLGGVADMEREPDGKYLITTGKALARFMPDGQPDFSGATAYDTTPYENMAYGMAVQADGRIVVVGEVKYSGSDSGFSAVRYMPNGEVDRSFAENGRYQYNLQEKQVAESVAILADQRIAISGWSASGSQGANFLTMILSSEGVDEKTLFLDFDRGNDVAQEVLPLVDGGFVVVGHADINGQRQIALARYTAAGRLDTSFGDNGKITTFVGTGGVSARGATLQPDGKILVAGAHDSNFLVLRYNPDGSLDISFGDGGIVDMDSTIDIGEEEAKDIVVLPSGLIVAAGYSSGDFGLLFLHEDGRVCANECNINASQPFLRTDFGGIEVPFAMVVQPDQRIVVVGGARGTYPTESSFLAARYIWRVGRGYILDTAFGSGGKLVDEIMPSAVARDVALDGQGRLLVAGYGHNYREYDFLLARYLTSSEPPPVSNPIERIFLPAQENGPGSGWKAGVQVQNTGTTLANISYSGFAANGSEVSCGASMTGPGVAANFLTDSACPNGHPVLNAGIVHADQPVVAITNVNNVGVGVSGGQYRGTSQDDVSSNIFFPLVKHNHSGRTTAFSVQNTSSEAANITAEFNVNGQTYTRVYTAVPALTSVLITPADAGVPAGNGQVGSLSLVGSKPLAGASLEFEHDAAVTENLQTAAAFSPADYDTQLYCPLYRNAHSAKRQTSGVQVQNVTGAVQTISFTYTPVGGGAQVNSSQQVQPGASATFYAPAIGIPEGSVGSVVLQGQGNIVAVVNEAGTEADGRRVMTTYQCFPANRATTKVMVPLYKEFYNNNTSGIQVQNVVGDGSPATVQVTYRATNSSAEAVFSHSTAIPDGGSITFWGVSNLSSPAGITAVSGSPAALSGTYGSVVITANKPIVAIANETTAGSTGGQDAKNYEGFNQ